MKFVYFKTGSAPPVELFISGGRIDYSALGNVLELDPTSIILNGTVFPGEAPWEEIEEVLKMRGVPAGTKEDPVIVTGKPRVHGVSTEGGLSSKKSKWPGVGHQPLETVKMTGNRTDGITSRLNSYRTMREGTVEGLSRLILEKGAVLLQAPPQSGKTSLLELMMTSESIQSRFKRFFYVSLAQLPSGKTFDDIWGIYVRDGISFSDVLKSPKSFPEGKHKQQASQASMPPDLLLVDEGHVGFKEELELWHVLKSVQSAKIKHLRMLIVSAWGSNDIVVNENVVGTWGSDSVVGLWPAYNTSVALQLTEEEAMELWEGWSMGAGLGNSIRDYIFELTDRQPGLLTHVIDWLDNMNLSNKPFERREEYTRERLLSSDLCDSLSSIRSIRRLSEGIARGENVKPLKEFLRVLLQKCEVPYGELSQEQEVGARLALKWGQVTEINVDGGRRLKLPSRLHEIYFMRKLYQNRNEGAYVK